VGSGGYILVSCAHSNTNWFKKQLKLLGWVFLMLLLMYPRAKN